MLSMGKGLSIIHAISVTARILKALTTENLVFRSNL